MLPSINRVLFQRMIRSSKDSRSFSGQRIASRLGSVFVALGLLAAVAHTQADGISQQTLHAAHEALFTSFIPLSQMPPGSDQARMFQSAEDAMWSAAGQSPAFQSLLRPFADLRSLGRVCGIPDFLKTVGSHEFAQLDTPQREHVLALLETCSNNESRRLFMNVRNLYLSRTYGALQEPLSGIALHLYADAKFIESHRPMLLPSRLHYDRSKKEIAFKDGEIDYLIVGSGPAGSVLAHELRRGGKRVLLVERGSFTVPGAMETRMIDSLVDSRTSTDGGIYIHNGMAVGGGSEVNVDLCFAPTRPSVQAKIDGWRREGRIGKEDFTYSQLASAYEWVKSAIGTRVLSEEEINSNNRVLWQGAKLARLHPKLYDLNTYPPGGSPYPVTDKRSSESQLLIEALNDKQNALSLLPDADVRRILFDGPAGARKAVGVEVQMRASVAGPGIVADPNGLALEPGENVTIRARTVILSAGALGSPTILLRSGIANDQIGRGVVLHVSMPVMGRFDHPIDALKGTQASVYVDDGLVSDGYALESMSAQPVYAALMSPGSATHSLDMVKNYRTLAGFGVMLIDTPSPNNRLTLDQGGEPQIDYELSESDKARFRHGVAQAVRIMFLAGAKEVYLPTTEDVLGMGDEAASRGEVLTSIHQADAVERNLQFLPNRTILTSAHMQATDKMGAAPADSVVSREFRVWGTQGLYVVDGSIFPTSIGANPMQSIYTFAKVFADRMAAAH
jgi:choline dehydrogenase-like flavoprotein